VSKERGRSIFDLTICRRNNYTVEGAGSESTGTGRFTLI